jgi:Tol biopolymer transport system component
VITVRCMMRVAALLVAVLVVGGGAGSASGAGAAATELISQSTGGVVGDQESGLHEGGAVSAHGHYVAFTSRADNLVTGDTNGADDVFVRDRLAGTTTRVSVSSGGAQANYASDSPSISADGRYVAFESGASNLVDGDTNSYQDVFVRDRVAGTTTLVSVPMSGGQGNRGSGDFGVTISADGRYVAFASDASNLVAGDTNGQTDVFVRDLAAGTTTRVSVSSSGAEGTAASGSPVISANGRYVAFTSWASNLVASDTNGGNDVFVHDRVAGTTERVSVSATGGELTFVANERPAISADGRYVAFAVSEDNVYVRDRLAHTTELVSVNHSGVPGQKPSEEPAISADGRFVAFFSAAGNLVSGGAGWHVYVRDRLYGTTRRVDVSDTGALANGVSENPSISADGSYVAFESLASNLVAGDTNTTFDVFGRALGDAKPTCAGKPATIVGTGGDDVIAGTPGSDVIVAGAGNDTIHGAAGNDTVCGNTGNDQVFGNGGNDRIIGGAGNDALHGGIGFDRCNGGTGTDTAVNCETRLAIP